MVLVLTGGLDGVVLQHVLIQRHGSSKIMYSTVAEAVFDFTVSPVADITALLRGS